MAETDSALVDHKIEKEGSRLRALRECFHRALRLALDCPTWEVNIHQPAPNQSLCVALTTLNVQEFAACFKDLPEHYTVALFDLYQQVTCMASWCRCAGIDCLADLAPAVFCVAIGTSPDQSQLRGKQFA